MEWQEWGKNEMNDIGMTEWDRRSDSQNRHLIQLILMSCVSFRHHPIAVYNGEDSLMTPKWGPRQVRSGQLSLTKTHVYFFLSQAHSLTTEYSTTGSQKVIYLLAAIGKPTHYLHFIPPIPNPFLEKVGRILSINLAIQDKLIKSFCRLQRARCQPSWCWQKSCWKV